MPAHRSEPILSPALPILQNLWRMLIEQNFLLYPSQESMSLDEDNDKNQICIFPQTKIRSVSENLALSLKLPLLFRSFITKTMSTQDKLDTEYKFNYFGPNSFKQNYFDYLNKFFWQNQDSPELANHPDLIKIVEDSTNLLRYETSFKNLNLCISSDFFDDKTAQMMANLSQSFDGWGLDPYFLRDGQGNIQWQIKIKQKLCIAGSIYQYKSKMCQQVEMIDLTKNKSFD